jgi:hypothetical protein
MISFQTFFCHHKTIIAAATNPLRCTECTSVGSQRISSGKKRRERKEMTKEISMGVSIPPPLSRIHSPFIMVFPWHLKQRSGPLQAKRKKERKKQRCPYTLSPFTLSPVTLSRSLCPPVTLSPVTLSPGQFVPRSLCPSSHFVPVTLYPVTLSPGHFVPRLLCPRSGVPSTISDQS